VENKEGHGQRFNMISRT